VKVLILEDDASAAEVLSVRLNRLECETFIARTIAEAHSLALTEQPNLVMVDCKVQGNRNAGLDFITELKSNPHTANIKAIVHSVYILRQSDLPSGANTPFGLLRKPFRREELTALIAEARRCDALAQEALVGNGVDNESNTAG
jgi:CheY-like chemotaxis protein